MNYVNDYGIPFFRGRQKKGGRKDRSEQNASSSLFFLFLTLPLNNLSCWQCGPWVWDLRPCERTVAAAESVEGEGRGTMTHTRNRGGRQGKNAGLVVGRLDID